MNPDAEMVQRPPYLHHPLAMGNTTLTVLAWLAVALHAVVGVFVARRITALPLLPIVNGLVALAVLAYWVPKWFAVVTRNIVWYWSDQALPVYALVVLVLVGTTLAGRTALPVVHWSVFVLHAVVLLAAALFFTFFRMDRMI